MLPCTMRNLDYSTMQENFASVFDDIVTNDTPLIINKNGAKAVIMSVDYWNGWQETLYLLGNPANAAQLLKSIHNLEQDNHKLT